jgi:hypothetical protein
LEDLRLWPPITEAAAEPNEAKGLPPMGAEVEVVVEDICFIY